MKSIPVAASADLAEAAQRYAKHGWRIIPLHGVSNGACTCGDCACRSAGKHPRTKGGVKDASADPKRVAAWWRQWPDANIGFATGAQEDGSSVIVIDVDEGRRTRTDGVTQLKRGRTELARLEVDNGEPLPRSWVSRTGSDGLHIFVRVPSDCALPATLAPSIDVKAEGGYAIVPPSAHASGNRYQWERGGFDLADLLGNPDPIPEAPSWLIELGRSRTEGGTESGAPAPKTGLPFDEFASAVRAIINDERFNDRAAWRDVGFGIHAETDGSPEGLELFDAWSKTWTGGRYDSKATRAVWDSAKLKGDDRKVSGRTVVWLAKRDGWAPPFEVGDGGDAAAGDAFARAHAGYFLYVHDEKSWLRFDGTRWQTCRVGEEREAMKAFAKRFAEKAFSLFLNAETPTAKEIRKNAMRLPTLNSRMSGALECAKSVPSLRATSDRFDRDPDLLCVANGVLNLRTRELIDPTPDQMNRKLANVGFDPSAQAPAFGKFIEEIFPDREVRRFVQVASGYALTGHVTDDKFFVHHGSGANGKSVLANIMSALMGDYAAAVGDALISKNAEKSETRHAVNALKGVRLAYVNETHADEIWNDKTLKSVTSTEAVATRQHYRALEQFYTTHKLVIRSNAKPGAHDATDGFWRRLVLIPFEVQIPEGRRNPELAQSIIRDELPGVLNWLLDGVQEWYRAGECVLPARLRREVELYRSETDVLGEWLQKCTERSPDFEVPTRYAYESLKRYFEGEGLKPPSKTRLTRELATNHGIEKRLGNPSDFYRGIKMREMPATGLFD